MKDFLYLHLKDLPYFRALIRGVEAVYYQDLNLPGPVLDVGCGDGHFASLTFDRKIDVGIDPWHGPVQEAGSREAYVQLVEGDAGQTPFPDGYFSSAISNSVLEHIPHIDRVLAETSRVLKPGAPFYFCVPNPRYLSELSLSTVFGPAYTEWFRRISRVHHADDPDVWQKRLDKAGFELVRWWHYFSPQAMRVLEWGHYFGLPSLVVHVLTRKWILVPAKWNLALTERCVRKFASPEPVENGTFTFYVARKLAAADEQLSDD
ncbi:MAG: class I SAM-dependent methyltransferase [Anaerolineales bacterium]|nr:class I SAM-dependent methyltransferase [Anaerolineales bacterium]